MRNAASHEKHSFAVAGIIQKGILAGYGRMNAALSESWKILEIFAGFGGIHRDIAGC
jgi:hypothetical protein